MAFTVSNVYGEDLQVLYVEQFGSYAFDHDWSALLLRGTDVSEWLYPEPTENSPATVLKWLELCHGTVALETPFADAMRALVS